MTMRAEAARRPWWKWPLGAFCLYHMAAMVFANMAPTTPFGTELRAPFEKYIAYAGLWQEWSLFVTIPAAQSISPMLVARYADDTWVERGPILPGLLPYRPRARLIALFFRLTYPDPDFDWFSQRYVERACDAFEREIGARPQNVQLRLDTEALIPLADVIKTGKMGAPTEVPGNAVATCN